MLSVGKSHLLAAAGPLRDPTEGILGTTVALLWRSRACSAFSAADRWPTPTATATPPAAGGINTNQMRFVCT